MQQYAKLCKINNVATPSEKKNIGPRRSFQASGGSQIKASGRRSTSWRQLIQFSLETSAAGR